ncbi:MAG: hypothetical protein KC503_12305 [Myxococcales bacterium]|nr:hypothetical protein [Myxococcales bacterium]
MDKDKRERPKPPPIPLDVFLPHDETGEAHERGTVRVSSDALAALAAGSSIDRGLVELCDGDVRHRLTVYFPPDLITRLYRQCAESGDSFGEVVVRALDEHLDRERPLFEERRAMFNLVGAGTSPPQSLTGLRRLTLGRN